MPGVYEPSNTIAARQPPGAILAALPFLAVQWNIYGVSSAMLSVKVGVHSYCAEPGGQPWRPVSEIGFAAGKTVFGVVSRSFPAQRWVRRGAHRGDCCPTSVAV